MWTVKVAIAQKDRYVGAMVRALAVEAGNYSTVKGQSKSVLRDKGYFVFEFKNQQGAVTFWDAVQRYLPGVLAVAQMPTTLSPIPVWS